MSRGARPTWLIALVLSTAACDSPDASAPSVAAPPSAAVWTDVAECPVLADPPYGLPGKGVLNEMKLVDTATAFEFQCEYVGSVAQPLLVVYVQITRTADGSAQRQQEYVTQRAAASDTPGVDFADVPGVGEGAFAVYDQSFWNLGMRTRSGNAAVMVEFLPGRPIAEKWSATAPLQEQLPLLTPVLKTAVAALR